MNKTMHSQVLPMLFLMVALPVAQIGYTDDTTYTATATTATPATDAGSAAETLVTYLYNLGGDLGFDLKTAAATSPISTLLLSPPTILDSMAAVTLITMIGAIPVDSSPENPPRMNFVPANNATYVALNTLANTTFSSYNSPAGATSTSTAVSVTPLIDQPTFQSDPVSQFILNLLSTPNSTYCMDPTGTTWLNNNSQTIGDCTYLYGNKILNNVIGSLPPTPFLLPGTQNPVIHELNSNALVAPLMYTTTPSNTAPPKNKSPSMSPGQADNPGMLAKSQVEQATNFIRYATGSVMPLPSPSQVNYNNLLLVINTPTNTRATIEAAMATLDTYLTGMRIYAAKASVPVSNLYYILSKRLPQAQSNSGTQTNGMSQALSEMSMATRRMYDPAAEAAGKPQWITQINTASPATVQKEMAILLSEINYQLYLNRQQEERLLLTNSLLLIESLKQEIPQVPASDSLPSATPEPDGGGADTGE